MRKMFCHFSGEVAFRIVSSDYYGAKNPLKKELHRLSKRVPLLFIYGGSSWLTKLDSKTLNARRNHSHNGCIASLIHA